MEISCASCARPGGNEIHAPTLRADGVSIMAFLQKNAFRIVLGLAIVLAVYWLVQIVDARQIIRGALQRIGALGPWAPFWFVLVYIVACLTFFPAVIFTLGAGILFGVIKGTALVSLGATLGAACAFLLSRYLAREWVLRKFSNLPHFRVIDAAVANEGWKIVGLIRLSPAFPFSPLNFVFGLTRIPFLHFVGITWLALIPMSSLFVYLGSLIGEIAALGAVPIATGRAKWVVTGIGLTSTIIVTFFVTRIVRRVLSETLEGFSSGTAESSENRQNRDL
jgi:uncharacterized membrane protein YdjX (TVP38/TMEM64 family)